MSDVKSAQDTLREFQQWKRRWREGPPIKMLCATHRINHVCKEG